jgi:hypothetical protein
MLQLEHIVHYLCLAGYCVTENEGKFNCTFLYISTVLYKLDTERYLVSAGSFVCSCT